MRRARNAVNGARGEVEGIERFVTPILHALVPRKDEAIYDKLWRMIRAVRVHVNMY